MSKKTCFWCGATAEAPKKGARAMCSECSELLGESEKEIKAALVDPGVLEEAEAASYRAPAKKRKRKRRPLEP